MRQVAAFSGADELRYYSINEPNRNLYSRTHKLTWAVTQFLQRLIAAQCAPSVAKKLCVLSSPFCTSRCREKTTYSFMKISFVLKHSQWYAHIHVAVCYSVHNEIFHPSRSDRRRCGVLQYNIWITQVRSTNYFFFSFIKCSRLFVQQERVVILQKCFFLLSVNLYRAAATATYEVGAFRNRPLVFLFGALTWTQSRLCADVFMGQVSLLLHFVASG